MFQQNWVSNKRWSPHGKLQRKAPNPNHKTSMYSQARSCYCGCLVTCQLLGVPVNKYFDKKLTKSRGFGFGVVSRPRY